MQLSAADDTGGTVVSTATDLASQLTSIYQQKKLIDMNAARAAQGLPPLDSSALAAQVQVSASPEQVQQITSLMLYGIGAVMLMLFMTRKR